jgi:serine protease
MELFSRWAPQNQAMPLSSFKTSILCALLASHAMWAAASEHNPVAHEPRLQPESQSLAVIVKLRKNSPGMTLMKLSSGTDRVTTLAKRTGLALRFTREISDSLLANAIELNGASPEHAMAALSADPAVEYVTRDEQRYPHAISPNDSLFEGQWYLKNTEVSAVNAINAWDRELGTAGVVVAVLDTGILYDHPDLGRGDRGGKLLPGYDFVSQDHMVNDGNARDADPSDPGDWLNASDKAGNPLFGNCETKASSWHGTRVAGMIGALTNNATGVSGLSWNSFLLPVRVLGKCGGTDSDILAGMRWAGGLSVPGAPVNPTPARIINASLGSSGQCNAAYRDVIEELAARKVLLVISAGNEGTVVSSPGNCPGVAAVAAIRHAGSKVGFSSLGPEVSIAAPGGNCVNINGGPCLFSLDTTSNSGSEGPVAHIYTDQTNSNLGTSFSAPIVSGIAALMLSRNANLSTTELLDRLREGARPFPTSVPDDPAVPVCHMPADSSDVQLAQCLCTTSTCGAGMVDAARSIEAADRPIAAISMPTSVSPGQNVTFNAGGSTAACNRSVAGFSWAVVAPISNPPAILGANTSTATVLAPTSGSVTLRVTVTDNQGRSDSAEVMLGPESATSTAPGMAGNTPCAAAVTSGPTPGSGSSSSGSSSSSSSSSSSGGGGGGRFDLLSLLGLTALTLHLRRKIRRCI